MSAQRPSPRPAKPPVQRRFHSRAQMARLATKLDRATYEAMLAATPEPHKLPERAGEPADAPQSFVAQLAAAKASKRA